MRKIEKKIEVEVAKKIQTKRNDKKTHQRQHSKIARRDGTAKEVELRVNVQGKQPNHQQGKEGQVGDEQARPHHPQAAGRQDGNYQDQKYIPLGL